MRADELSDRDRTGRSSVAANTNADRQVAQVGDVPGTRGWGWKTALVLGGSVLLGAAAVALWNRRSVAKLHQQVRESK